MKSFIGLALLALVAMFGMFDGIAWYVVLVELFLAFVLYTVLRLMLEAYFDHKLTNAENFFNKTVEEVSSAEEKKYFRRKADIAIKALKDKLELEKDGMLSSVLAIVVAMLFFPALTPWVLLGGIVVSIFGLLNWNNSQLVKIDT